MRAVFRKELRELRIALFVIAVLGVITGFALKCEPDVAMGMIVAVGLLGLPLGAMQGWLDRAAVRDQFLLHRPVPVARLHAARTLAGAVAACVVAAVPLGVMLLVPWGRGLPLIEPLLDESSDPQWRDVTAGRVAFAALLCVAMWSVARLGASARRTLVATAGALGLASALAFAVVRVSGSVTASVALVVAAIAVATWTNAVVVARGSEGDDAEGSCGRRLAWKALACAFAVVVTLELAYWLRPWAHLLRKTGSAFVEVTDDGKPQLVAADWKYEDGKLIARRRIYDDSGNYLREEIKPGPSSPRDWTPAATPFWGTHWQHPAERLGHVLDMAPERGDWADAILRRLAGAQGVAFVPTSRAATGAPGTIENRTRAWFSWTFEDGRFICRDAADGSVVSGFGPDGARSGATAVEGERFDRRLVALALALPTYDQGGKPMPFVLVDPDRHAVHFIRAEAFAPGLTEKPPRWVDTTKTPVRVVVKTIAVAGPDGEAPAPLQSIAHGDWMQFHALALSPTPGDREKIAVPIAAGPEIVEVSENGIVRRAPMDGDEAGVMTSGSDRFLWSLLPPVDGSVPRLRTRWWRDDGTLTRCDADVPPVTLQAKCGLALAGMATLLRPPAANALSFAGPRVANWDDSFTRWFTDPLIAGGDGGGWLAGSLAVAAVCAGLARRAAIVRSPNRVLAWTIAGAVLGVAGLAWMRLVVPRSHVAVCACGRRRAVHLANCPACSTAWPAPSPTGIEVFA